MPLAKTGGGRKKWDRACSVTRFDKLLSLWETLGLVFGKPLCLLWKIYATGHTVCQWCKRPKIEK